MPEEQGGSGVFPWVGGWVSAGRPSNPDSLRGSTAERPGGPVG